MSGVQPYVTFTPLIKQGLRPVRVMLGDGAAKPAGAGGWNVIARPKKIGFTIWDGQDPETMVIPVMFDGLARETSVEADVAMMRAIMRTPVGPLKQPSPVRFTGPLPGTSLPWVIQEFAEGEIIRRQRDGQMIRCTAEISLLQYVEADVLLSSKSSPAKASNDRKATTAAKPKASRSYTVKRGDTLSKIAASQLGSYKRASEIAKLNNLRDPNSLKVGQVLRLP